MGQGHSDRTAGTGQPGGGKLDRTPRNDSGIRRAMNKGVWAE